VPKPLLLYTERPVLLARERATHEWMFREKPWEVLDLELLYDNLPGGWPHYAETFQAAWERARREARHLFVMESDVLPTLDSFRQLLACREDVCVFPYPNPLLGDPPRYGVVVENRVPGGWESHFAREGEEWVVDADLGLCRFSPRAVGQPWPGDVRADGHLTGEAVLINTALFRQFRSKDPRTTRGNVHCHWPAIGNRHLTWDEGDDAHHPPERREEMHRIHTRWLDPSLKP
jgi:hypothetical protein